MDRLTVEHQCGAMGEWKIYSGRHPFGDFINCKCGVKRPPNHIRRQLKLVNFLRQLGGY